MPQPPYRALRIVLRVFSILVAVGSLLMIFGSEPVVVRIFMRPPKGEVSTLLLFVLSVLLWWASRDPVRNVGIVDALIVGLCILSVTPLLSLWMLPVGAIYPA